MHVIVGLFVSIFSYFLRNLFQFHRSAQHVGIGIYGLSQKIFFIGGNGEKGRINAGQHPAKFHAFIPAQVYLHANSFIKKPVNHSFNVIDIHFRLNHIPIMRKNFQK